MISGAFRALGTEMYFERDAKLFVGSGIQQPMFQHPVLFLLTLRGSRDTLDGSLPKLYGPIWSAKHLPNFPGKVIQQECVVVGPASGIGHPATLCNDEAVGGCRSDVCKRWFIGLGCPDWSGPQKDPERQPQRHYPEEEHSLMSLRY